MTKSGDVKEQIATIAGIVKDIAYMQKDIEYIKQHFAMKEDLLPIENDVSLVKKIIFGVISAILLAIVGAGMTVLLR